MREAMPLDVRAGGVVALAGEGRSLRPEPLVHSETLPPHISVSIAALRVARLSLDLETSKPTDRTSVLHSSNFLLLFSSELQNTCHHWHSRQCGDHDG